MVTCLRACLREAKNCIQLWCVQSLRRRQAGMPHFGMQAWNSQIDYDAVGYSTLYAHFFMVFSQSKDTIKIMPTSTNHVDLNK